MIKKLNKKYLKDIMELHEKAIYPLWDGLRREYSREGVKYFVKSVFEKGEVYGYFEKSKLIGSIGLEGRKNICEIAFLLVNPKHQGKGIGRKLMDLAEGNGNYNRIILDVLTKNPAVEFYKKLGYKIIKTDGIKNKYFMEKVK